MSKLLMIDNYDSFTYNLVQYFAELGCEVSVYRNDKISVEDIHALAPDYLVISPGPCTPNEAGVSLNVIEAFSGKIPMLGVCLGHQSIAQTFGGQVVRADEIMHGKVSEIYHDGTGLYQNLPSPLKVTRYHSLIAESLSLPECLAVTAYSKTATGEKIIMSFSHKQYAIHGVQYHPESILTEGGKQILKNFLSLARNNV